MDKLGLTYTQYLVMMVLWEYGGMTEEGDALKKKAVNVPLEMKGCLKLSEEEFTQLKGLLDKVIQVCNVPR